MIEQHIQEENLNLTKEIANLKTKLNLRMAYQTDIPNLKTAMMSKEINLDNNFNTISVNDNNNNNFNKSTILNDDNHHNFDLSRRSNSRLSYDYTNKKIRTAHIRGSFLHLQIDCVQTRNDFLQSLFLCMFHPPLYPAFCDGIEQNQQTKTV